VKKNIISVNQRFSARSAFQFRLGSALSVLAGGCLVLAACVAVPAAPACSISYAVTPGKKDAEVSYQTSGRGVTVDVRSGSGIGSAALAQTGGPAPASVTMRLHLKGLEQFTFQYPAATVAASVSSHDGSVSESVSVDGGAAQPIAEDSPYWLPVRINAADPAIPLKDGYFEVQAPQDFLTSASREFTLRWVDFYR
jgi:hypothetical protein